MTPFDPRDCLRTAASVAMALIVLGTAYVISLWYTRDE